MKKMEKMKQIRRKIHQKIQNEQNQKLFFFKKKKNPEGRTPGNLLVSKIASALSGEINSGVRRSFFVVIRYSNLFRVSFWPKGMRNL